MGYFCCYFIKTHQSSTMPERAERQHPSRKIQMHVYIYIYIWVYRGVQDNIHHSKTHTHTQRMSSLGESLAQ